MAAMIEASDWRRGLIQDYKQLQQPWGSACLSVALRFLWGMWTLVEACHRERGQRQACIVHSSGGQSWGSRLPSYNCTAGEAWVGYWCTSWAPGGQRIRSRERLRWLVTVNANTHVAKTSEIHRVLWLPCWPLVSSVANLLGLFVGQVTFCHNDGHCMAAAAFHPCS